MTQQWSIHATLFSWIEKETAYCNPMWEFSNGGGEGHGIKNIFNPNLSSDKCKGCAGFIILFDNICSI